MLQNFSHPNLTLLSHGSTLSLPNNLLFLSSRKQFAFPLSPINNPDHTLLRRLNSTIFASSIKKPRANRKGRSNADLRNEIWEFVSAVGLPEGHVPSLKEFSQHGRQDLANIVRRRGYKFIKELLATSTKYDRNESDTEEVLIKKHVMSSDHKHESPGQDEKVEDMAEDVFSSSEVSVKQNHLVNRANIDSSSSSDNKNFMALESSANSSLQEKVAKFFQNGELDTFEDDDFGNLNEIEADDDKGFVEIEKVRKESSSLGEEHSEWVLGQADTAKVLNGSVSPRPASINNTLRDEFSSERLLSADCDEELDVETRKRENQIEINHLKLMLHQRELELSQLKEQIEKEQLALSILQTKAETEISKAQKLILEKDAELHSAEESLSGLEEVQIQFWGDGETVEVAGSFNGWHHRITMEQQPLSSISDPIGSRKSRLWTTVLWLYPGTYEIKFIVDGQWRIDPERELVTQGTIQNNILRVGR